MNLIDAALQEAMKIGDRLRLANADDYEPGVIAQLYAALDHCHRSAALVKIALASNEATARRRFKDQRCDPANPDDPLHSWHNWALDSDDDLEIVERRRCGSCGLQQVRSVYSEVTG